MSGADIALTSADNGQPSMLAKRVRRKHRFTFTFNFLPTGDMRFQSLGKVLKKLLLLFLRSKIPEDPIFQNGLVAGEFPLLVPIAVCTWLWT